MHADAGDDRARWVKDALDRFEAPLVLYATRLLDDVHAARDAVQETFLRLVRVDLAERADVTARLAPWLYTVCRNLATDERRKGRHMARTNAPSMDGRAVAEAPPDSAAERDDSTASALRAIDALPANQQEVLRLKFRHGLSYRDIAEVTGLTVSHVGVLIHDGMRTLRVRLSPERNVRAANEGGAR